MTKPASRDSDKPEDFNLTEDQIYAVQTQRLSLWSKMSCQPEEVETLATHTDLIAAGKAEKHTGDEHSTRKGFPRRFKVCHESGLVGPQAIQPRCLR